MNIFKTWAALAASALVVACGGGDGGGSPSVSAPGVTPPQASPTPPSVSAPSVSLPPALPIPAGRFDAAITPHASLQFAKESAVYVEGASLGNAIFKPAAGSAPFPSIVLTPSCGGAGGAIRERLVEFLNAGYLVLVLDNYRQRGQLDCRNGVVTAPRVWLDALDGLAHLQTVKDVDTTKVYQVGYSMGSFSAAALSSPSMVTYFNSSYRFKASVGWYGGCGFQNSASAPVSQFLRSDTDRPLLLLMADADRETPIQPFCFPLLDDLKTVGRPVEWYVYPSPTTHAWDVRAGYTIVNGWGETITNSYDAAATADATRRTLEFLAKNR